METHQTAQTQQTATPSSASSLTPEAVTVNRAAQLAGVCRRTIYAWISRGLVETRYTAGGALRIVVSSLFHDERPSGVAGRSANLRRRAGGQEAA